MVIVKKVLVAVYGSLRQGLGNYERLLKDEKFIGQFETEPEYTLVDLGSFPGLIEEGSTSVTMEVFEIGAEKLKKLDSLEGYRNEDDESNNFYNRVEIQTPFGKGYTYIYNGKAQGMETVESGNWTDYYKTKLVRNLC